MALKNPVFVLEGGDGTGKTTLGDAIQMLTGSHYIHLTYAPHLVGHMIDYQKSAALAAIELSEFFPVVIDRWVPSEVVYSNVFRNGNCETTPAIETAILKDYGKDFVYVFCHPTNKDEYIAAFEKLKGERKEMYDTVSKVWDEYEAYIARFLLLGFSSCVYDRFSQSPGEVAEKLVKLYPGTAIKREKK